MSSCKTKCWQHEWGLYLIRQLLTSKAVSHSLRLTDNDTKSMTVCHWCFADSQLFSLIWKSCSRSQLGEQLIHLMKKLKPFCTISNKISFRFQKSDKTSVSKLWLKRHEWRCSIHLVIGPRVDGSSEMGSTSFQLKSKCIKLKQELKIIMWKNNFLKGFKILILKNKFWWNFDLFCCQNYYVQQCWIGTIESVADISGSGINITRVEK